MKKIHRETFTRGARVEVTVEYGERFGIRPALRLLSRTMIDLVVEARHAQGVHKPAQVESREQETERWANG